MRTIGHHRLFPILLILSVAVTTRVVVAQDSVEQLWQQGTAAETAGKYDRAEEILRKVLQLDPQNANAYNLLGIVLRRQKRFDEAIAAFQKAIQFNPKNAKNYLALGAALIDQNKFDEAIVAFQKAIQLNPKNTAGYIGLGISLTLHEKFDEAIVAYEKAIQLNPKDASAYRVLGDVLRRHQKFDQAIATYQKAIQLNPKDTAGYTGLGHALRDWKKFDEAIAAYQTAIQLDPKCAKSYIDLGGAFILHEKYDSAIAAFHKAIRLPNDDLNLSPSTNVHAVAYNYLGLVFKVQSKLKEAIDRFDKAETLDPNYAYASSNNIEARRLWTEQQNQLTKVENDRQWLPKDPNLKIKRSVVQITSKFSTRERQGIEMGTGVVIDRSNNRTLILTARHVVFAGNEQGENIQVEFFSSPPSNRVRMRRDANPLPNTTNDKQVDLVVLEVKGQLPDDIQPIPMSQATNATARSVQIIGHYVQNKEYLPWSIKSGKIKSYDENQRLVITQSNLKYGFSGAPLLDNQNRLLGMAIEIRGDKQEDYAYSNSTIKKQLSTWKISLKP